MLNWWVLSSHFFPFFKSYNKGLFENPIGCFPSVLHYSFRWPLKSAWIYQDTLRVHSLWREVTCCCADLPFRIINKSLVFVTDQTLKLETMSKGSLRNDGHPP